MGIAETAFTCTPAVVAKMPNCAVFPKETVIKVFSVTTGLPKLDMVFDFLCNGCWILSKLTADAFDFS